MKFRDYTDYEVYEDGRIYSYKRKKFLKPATLPNGYKQVCITDNEGKAKCYLLHRVVFEAVSGEPIPTSMEINHIDERKDNNSKSNLQLVSHNENCNFGTRNTRISKSNTNNTNRSKQVGAYKNGKLVMVFPSTIEAQRQGFNSGNVSSCCRNCYHRPGNNVYKGFTWKYI